MAILCCFPQRRNMIWKTCGGIPPLHVPCLSSDAVSVLAVGWTCNNHKECLYRVVARQNSVRSAHQQRLKFQNFSKMEIIHFPWSIFTIWTLAYLYKCIIWSADIIIVVCCISISIITSQPLQCLRWTHLFTLKLNISHVSKACTLWACGLDLRHNKSLSKWTR